MENVTPPKPTAPPEQPRPADLGAAVLSYLVPGLGQIYQGRIGKGLLFLVCLYGLFFYGMYLGKWSNVYLPDTVTGNPASNTFQLPRPLANLYNRLQFAGQVWIGVAAWPAIWQYYHYDTRPESSTNFGKFQRQPDETVINQMQVQSGKRWDLGWVYTVIAGVLNILVIYDALAGPTFLAESRPTSRLEGAPAA
jgi:TM2 domain-containing membrane protein YozV